MALFSSAADTFLSSPFSSGASSSGRAVVPVKCCQPKKLGASLWGSSIHLSAWRDCLESPNGLHFVVPLACTTVRNGTFLGASRCQRTCHSTRTATFQTVSEETVWKSERAGSMTYAPEHGEVLFDRSV